MSLDQFAQRLWYERRHRWLSLLLVPLAWLFGAVVRIRRWAYRRGFLRQIVLACPVIIVGNISVGGTGKTPLVAWLANECQRRGIRAAIICRGYRGQSASSPVAVQRDSDPQVVGDEAVLLAYSFDGIVIAGADRVAAARQAIWSGAEIVISDDGLQHYRLHRNVELLVVDAARGWGNTRLLPAGPLREPLQRADSADMVLRTRRGDGSKAVLNVAAPTIDVHVRVQSAVSLRDGEVRPLVQFRDAPVHALAAIGNPEAFFAMLRAQGLKLDTRILPDHAPITSVDLRFKDEWPVLMTDKDAVKCRAFSPSRLWRAPLQIDIQAADQARLWSIIQRAIDAQTQR